ncbi:MAG TPA: hypothetical protein PKY59_10255 [Pyrinomonadaceae bacterium]|nr:hypothetical protein [Pyrinomonadaceae bacterium]
MQKQGFKGQWIAISKKGKFTDSSGTERDLNESFLKEVIANFTPSDAPAVIGHPSDNAPAWGWVSALRLNNDVLEAQFADTDQEFEQMVETGKFRKRSASFYLNPPSLRHVGFLGAMPPAVKGLQDIQFSDGESVTVEISFKEQTMSNENLNTQEEKKTFSEWVKEFFGGKNPGSPSANFSEADQQSLIDKAVAKATEEAQKVASAHFAEELKKRDEQILELTQSVRATSVSGRRSEIISFVEAIPAEKGKHFLKRTGIVQFMEALAEADAKDEKEAISFSEGEGDAKVEHKFSRVDWFKNYVNAQQNFVEFGEKFGGIKATAEAGALIDPERQKKIDEAMKDGGAN